MTPAEQLFLECERARIEGQLIHRVSQSDKEFHFQNWVQSRLDACGLEYDDPGRNTYPDFRLVQQAEGFEVKGLAYPGRETNYDSNSQVPTGQHNGREIYYVFGRYPKDSQGESEYPVVDLVICHGSFLNADSNYVHKNKPVRGFGSYGDIMIRDRKMYVVPTPFALTSGTAGLATLITPSNFVPQSHNLVQVGSLDRIEVSELVSSYEFDLRTNDMTSHMIPNPNAGHIHRFKAFRSNRVGTTPEVSLKE